MENIKSLADQLREELVKPKPEKNKAGINKADKNTRPKDIESTIMAAIMDYDSSLNKSMVHVRFDEKTVRLMNQFKMATQVDVTKLVAYSVKHLFETHPELKQIIKHFIQNTEL